MAKEFNLTKATTSDSVKVLEQKGLVQRVGDANDSRSYNFSLTEKGEKVTEVIEKFTIPLDGAIATLEQPQKEYLLSSVLDLIFRLNQQGIISTQRMCYTCFYYGGNRKDHHFCNLMELPLAFDDLRWECPEHKRKE